MNDAYLPDRTAAFMRSAPPAERLMRLQHRMGLARDQQQVLRVVAANISQLLREGGVADRIALADLLDGCVDDLGKLLESDQ